MDIDILGSESLGVRGLCCVVRTSNRQFVIDPGLALGYKRQGLMPHPVQVAVGEDVRRSIVRALENSTDVVISHFHGDHMPLTNANPYQLSLDSVKALLKKPSLWMKGESGETPRIAERPKRLLAALERTASPCDGQRHKPLSFSKPMPHGSGQRPMGTVMMTRIEEGDEVFVHASDIQLLDDEPVSQIIDWHPTIVLLSGPPLYREIPAAWISEAAARAKALAKVVKWCIVDHHLLRSMEGVKWLNVLHAQTAGRVVCAADFMKDKCRLLEANRVALYRRMPVPENWHELYAEGLVDTSKFRK